LGISLNDMTPEKPATEPASFPDPLVAPLVVPDPPVAWGEQRAQIARSWRPPARRWRRP